MKNRGLIIAALVLAALLGLLYWSNRHPRSDNANVTPTNTSEAPPKILSLKADDITRVELKKKAGKSHHRRQPASTSLRWGAWSGFWWGSLRSA